ncbi:hypothetical protein ACET3Z_017452 [Daucus carota]
MIRSMDPDFENQPIELEENEEYEDTEQLKTQEGNNEEETSKQLSPPEVNTIFNSETEVYEYYRQYAKSKDIG